MSRWVQSFVRPDREGLAFPVWIKYEGDVWYAATDVASLGMVRYPELPKDQVLSPDSSVAKACEVYLASERTERYVRANVKIDWRMIRGTKQREASPFAIVLHQTRPAILSCLPLWEPKETVHVEPWRFARSIAPRAEKIHVRFDPRDSLQPVIVESFTFGDRKKPIALALIMPKQGQRGEKK